MNDAWMYCSRGGSLHDVEHDIVQKWSSNCMQVMQYYQNNEFDSRPLFADTDTLYELENYASTRRPVK